MIILGIDTSNLPLGVALVEGERVLAEITFNVGKNHSVRLMPAIEEIYREAGIEQEDTDLIAVAQGPGSYTGVRIGVATAKALAWGMDKPLVGVSSLKAVARQIPYFPGRIVPFFDARRNRLYTAVYRFQEGEWMEEVPEGIFTIQSLMERLKEEEENPVLFLGEGLDWIKRGFTEQLGGKAVFPSGEYWLPRASHVARLGESRYFRGEKENLLFTPNYLQRTEAEVRLQEKKGD